MYRCKSFNRQCFFGLICVWALGPKRWSTSNQSRSGNFWCCWSSSWATNLLVYHIRRLACQPFYEGDTHHCSNRTQSHVWASYSYCAIWSKLGSQNLQLEDPDFGSTSLIDLLLGLDVFADVLLSGGQFGRPGTPTAFETLQAQLKRAMQYVLVTLLLVTCPSILVMISCVDFGRCRTAH